MLFDFGSKEKKQQFIISYIAFVINGMLALSIGSLLPFIRDARGLDYVFSGMIVSLHSVGNLISSFAAGTLPVFIGRKRTILLFNSFFAIAFALIIWGKSPLALAVAFFVTGIARGASSNFNNKVVNSLAPGKAWIINGLHAMFAIGAFSFPIFLSLITKTNANNWIIACYFMLIMGALNFILYAIDPIENKVEAGAKKESADTSFDFFKEPIFWLCTLTLFFYLCVEQGVIGWLVTYFKDSGLLSSSASQITPSIQWIMILLGRLTAAVLSTKMQKTKLLRLMGLGFVTFFFVLLFSRTTPFIMLGIMGFGFSMSGIYATTISFSGKLFEKYTLSWSFLLTIASMGSILMPTVIGKIADNAGIETGMSSLVVVILIDVCMILLLTRYARKHNEDES